MEWLLLHILNPNSDASCVCFLHRLHTAQRAIKQTQVTVQKIGKEIEEKLRTTASCTEKVRPNKSNQWHFLGCLGLLVCSYSFRIIFIFCILSMFSNFINPIWPVGFSFPFHLVHSTDGKTLLSTSASIKG